MKRGAAAASGILLLVFAAGVLWNAMRRFITGAEPLGTLMVSMA